MKKLPIGFIDSGFGGLTVLKQSLKQLPNESSIYLGDSARAPYGVRSVDEIRRFIWQMTNFLREKGIKMLVIACNTGAAAALDEIRASLAIPVVGVIHAGSRAAILTTENNKVGIIGTPATINSDSYARIIHEKNAQLQVFSKACPDFVPIVEENQMVQPETMNTVANYLAPLKNAGVDTLVLGCTHYPHLRPQIQEFMGPEVELIDSGVETINEVSALLDYFNLSRSAEDAQKMPPTHTYYTTGSGAKFARFAQMWLGQPDLYVQECKIKGEIIHEASHR
ncbi:glutamate racemase [Eremococcus coleocola]|uniref:glutamate racemase n=1 Tax=Eremococcus coleocola TaxID=88132 RepID=UPI0003F81251|nr:glutamate racemase [Eremococcus coleocola]